MTWEEKCSCHFTPDQTTTNLVQEVTNVKVNGDHKETGRGILSEQETWYRDSSQMYGAVHGGLRVSLGRTRWRDSRSRQE